MSRITRKCDVCGTIYTAKESDIKRGWGLTCSKSCAAKKREMAKPGYNPEKVKRNNIRRAAWCLFLDEPAPKVNPPYNEDPGDSEYWDHSDNYTEN